MTSFNISVKNFREILDLLNTVVSEAKFKLDSSGMQVKAVDPAHVAMVTLDIPKEAFNDYMVDSEEELAVDIDRVKSVIKLASSGDNISVSKVQEKLKFELGTISKSIALLDNSTVSIPKVPQISSEHYVVVPKQYMEMGLKAAEDVSDSIRFILTADELRARSSSDSEDSEMVLPKDMLKEIKCTGQIKCSYPLEYLLKLVRSLSSADDLRLSFKDEYPLTINFNFGQGGKMKGSFLLAPRTE